LPWDARALVFAPRNLFEEEGESALCVFGYHSVFEQGMYTHTHILA